MKRRRVLPVLVASLLAAGCTIGPPSSVTARGAVGTADATAVDDVPCGTIDDGLRVVRHARGTARIAPSPRRVVVLDTGELDAAATVGLRPVGVVEVGDSVDVPANLAAFVEGVPRVGNIAQPNIEAIARLRPDLILGNRVRDDAIYDQLAQIAPTVFASDIGPMWRTNLELAAMAMGRCRQARTALAAYDAKVAALRQALGPDRSRLQVSVIRALSGSVRIYAAASFIGSILDDVGVARPPSQRKHVLMSDASIERIPEMDGDVLFVTQWGPVQPAMDVIEANPLWRNLRAVQGGRVFHVDDATWMLGLGATAATSVVDDLQRLLAGTPSPASAPAPAATPAPA